MSIRDRQCYKYVEQRSPSGHRNSYPGYTWSILWLEVLPILILLLLSSSRIKKYQGTTFRNRLAAPQFLPRPYLTKNGSTF